MKWRGRTQSSHVEDVRNKTTSRSSGSSFGIPVGSGKTGGIQIGGGIGIVLMLIMFLFGSKTGSTLA